MQNQSTRTDETSSSPKVKASSYAAGIIRVERHENKFAQISNATLQDKTLSFAARGLLAMLLSRPKDWQMRVGNLIHESPGGLRVVRSLLRELSLRGHVLRRRRRRRGRFAWDVVVYETPELAARAANQEPTESYPPESRPAPSVQNVPMENSRKKPSVRFAPVKNAPVENAPAQNVPIYKDGGTKTEITNSAFEQRAAAEKTAEPAAAKPSDDQFEILVFLCRPKPGGPGMSLNTATKNANKYPSATLKTWQSCWGEVARRIRAGKVIPVPVGLLLRMIEDGDKPSLFTSPVADRENRKTQSDLTDRQLAESKARAAAGNFLH